MANQSTISIKIKHLVDGKEQVDKASLSLEDLARAAQKAQKAFSRSMFDQAMTATGAFSQALSGLGSALDSLSAGYESFDKSMRAANTMAGKDPGGLKALTESVNGLAKAVPLAREALAGGLYQTISNGVPEDNWIEFLEASAKSAVGGMADLNSVVTVTATVLKNYGLEWSKAGAVQDMIQATAKNGVTSFEQMAAALPRVAGNAASLGVSIEELCAAFATLTGVSGNTAEVSTQLAAIFTALIKPSSQAQKVAEEMGITFNAAAIQAAGGLRNFVTSLDQAVNAYAQESGQLAKGIYAQLFGSAESLRALTPLVGELSEAFARNTEAMQASAGSIEEAFGQMSSTGEAKAQLLKNAFAGVSDALGSVASAAKPVVSPLIMVGQSAAGIAALGKACTALNAALGLSAISAKGLASALALVNMVPIGRSTAAIRSLGAALGISNAAANALLVTLRGVMAASVVGLAVLAVTEGIKAYNKSVEKAKEESERYARSLAELKKRLGEAKQASEEAFKQAGAEATVEMDSMARKLRQLIDSHGDESEAVRECNERYGDAFGQYRTAAEWYDTLTRKSKEYAVAKAYEAKAAALSQQYGQAAMEVQMGDEATERAALVRRKEQLSRAGKFYKPGRKIRSNLTDEGKSVQSALDRVDAAIKAKEEALAVLWQQVEAAYAEADSAMETVRAGSPAPANPQAAPAATAKAKPETEAAPDMAEVMGRSYASLDDYDTGLADLQKALGQAAREDLGAVAGAIRKLQAARDEFAAAQEPQLDITDVLLRDMECLDDYDKAIADLRSMEGRAGQERLAAIREAIEALGEERKAFEGVAQEAKEQPRTLQEIRSAELATLGDIDKAVQELTALRSQASQEEIAGYNAEIAKLQEKRALLLSLGSLPKARDPFADMSGFGKLKAGWGDVKGFASGIDGMTAALDRDKSAWERVASAIDGAIGIADAITGVAALVKSLTKHTEESAVANAVDAGAKQLNSEASAEAAAAEGGLAGMAMAGAEAAREEASAQLLDASSKQMNAYAWMPFVGLGLAAAGVAAMVAMLAGLPKFAEGGIAYGPTLGLFGEYSGAASNPEVVAPLDKLRDLIGAGGGGSEPRTVRLKLEGRDFVAALEANEFYRSRTR